MWDEQWTNQMLAGLSQVQPRNRVEARRVSRAVAYLAKRVEREVKGLVVRVASAGEGREFRYRFIYLAATTVRPKSRSAMCVGSVAV